MATATSLFAANPVVSSQDEQLQVKPLPQVQCLRGLRLYGLRMKGLKLMHFVSLSCSFYMYNIYIYIFISIYIIILSSTCLRDFTCVHVHSVGDLKSQFQVFTSILVWEASMKPAFSVYPSDMVSTRCCSQILHPYSKCCEYLHEMLFSFHYPQKFWWLVFLNDPLTWFPSSCCHAAALAQTPKAFLEIQHDSGVS